MQQPLRSGRDDIDRMELTRRDTLIGYAATEGDVSAMAHAFIRATFWLVTDIETVPTALVQYASDCRSATA